MSYTPCVSEQTTAIVMPEIDAGGNHKIETVQGCPPGCPFLQHHPYHGGLCKASELLNNGPTKASNGSGETTLDILKTFALTNECPMGLRVMPEGKSFLKVNFGGETYHLGLLKQRDHLEF